eukprot:gb/GEZN01008174.1/.p1 GENE.gb/GEZN01008174.1/~~gb/GEZN01008174.1/.p1  ORF type:complete len:445 (+),score=77.81 gb/GEZN01008174.1/:56-1390(+)
MTSKKKSRKRSRSRSRSSRPKSKSRSRSRSLSADWPGDWASDRSRSSSRSLSPQPGKVSFHEWMHTSSTARRLTEQERRLLSTPHEAKTSLQMRELEWEALRRKQAREERGKKKKTKKSKKKKKEKSKSQSKSKSKSKSKSCSRSISPSVVVKVKREAPVSRQLSAPAVSITDKKSGAAKYDLKQAAKDAQKIKSESKQGQGPDKSTLVSTLQGLMRENREKDYVQKRAAEVKLKRLGDDGSRSVVLLSEYINQKQMDSESLINKPLAPLSPPREPVPVEDYQTFKQNKLDSRRAKVMEKIKKKQAAKAFIDQARTQIHEVHARETVNSSKVPISAAAASILQKVDERLAKAEKSTHDSLAAAASSKPPPFHTLLSTSPFSNVPAPYAFYHPAPGNLPLPPLPPSVFQTGHVYMPYPPPPPFGGLPPPPPSQPDSSSSSISAVY